MRSIFSKLFRRSNSHTKVAETPVQPLDYEKLILLDAEDLAEQGIAEAYQQLLPELTKYVVHPADLTEILDGDVPSYKIRCDGQEYLVYSAEEPGTESESWGRATYFFFLIVNKQLLGTGVQLYAINGGNDLGALFLAPEEAKAAQSALPRKTDWPYIPTLNDSWYGQFH
ncbi:hypothetical protein BMD20_23010 [Burkholderia multivorans]|jgi:hypothetical protein|uniref:hypothetical protein n=1 Tax=Burkholderia multivorans TaxID=87883 RepID=UPI00057E87DD|nr:hypothetical protein [Burkholderia multivorans]AOJ94867.1 hypothetical protein WK22_17955 [Burkholderia multivorans]KHS10707.1 hypothetical protein BMD20_23010 [Burkholderia multivorans]KHS18036.1 hypothetical protein BMD22_08810 [Burkholderia multivorans]MDR8748281.1 hypothetical protein [Burkholderia multivorans]MDR8808553.1 hypothetical protein [Burkholderia multivorans]